jgi:hypothetical protein
MQLFQDLALAKIKVPNTLIAAIPVYNIGGALIERNSTTRANQDGPESYGLGVMQEITI